MNARIRDLFRADWLSLLIVVALASILLAVTESSFTQEFNLYVVIYNVTITSLVVLAQMVVVATGGMNIAVGAMGGLAAVMAAGLMESYGVPLPAVIVLGLAAGALMGFANGFLTIKTGINPFIITLAMASAYEGANLGITSANPYYNISTVWTAYGQARTALLPHPALVMIAVAIILGILFYRTVLGRSILAVGGNARSAELAGIPVGRVTIVAHVLSGLLAALAGLLLMARLGNGTPTIGSNWLLPSFAAVIIGGTALQGGAVSIFGAILATALLAIIENALVIRQADPYWVTFLEGALILAAVGLNRLRSAGGVKLFRGQRVAGPGVAAASKS
jgi:ribose transport system permease protein